MIPALLSPFGRLAAAALLLLAVVGWAMLERTGRHAAELRATQAEAAVAGRDIAIAALERAAAEASARAASFAAIRRSVDAAPPSRACADSPALRAALGGLRERAAGGGAGQPAVLPPGAASAGSAR